MKKFMKKYGFITLMLLGIVVGCVVGAVWPGATALEPFGTLFINMMFCVVVPMVFCSIASAIANMSSAKRAGRIMGITVGNILFHRCHCRDRDVHHRPLHPRVHCRAQL